MYFNNIFPYRLYNLRMINSNEEGRGEERRKSIRINYGSVPFGVKEDNFSPPSPPLKIYTVYKIFKLREKELIDKIELLNSCMTLKILIIKINVS